MLNTQNPVQSGTYCCTLPVAIYLTDYYVTCIQRQRIFSKMPCDSGGTRTLDPSIKSAVLYLLSYEVNKQHPCIMTGHIPNGNSCSIVYVVPICPTFGHWCCMFQRTILFVLTSAKLRINFQTTKCFTNFFCGPGGAWFPNLLIMSQLL